MKIMNISMKILTLTIDEIRQINDRTHGVQWQPIDSNPYEENPERKQFERPLFKCGKGQRKRDWQR